MEWIKSTERMPDDMEQVIVTIDKGDLGKEVCCDAMYDVTVKKWKVFIYGQYYWIFEGSVGCRVTHWMQIPKPAED